VNRAPTPKQAEKLRILGSGAIALAPGRGEWGPLLRRGWVEQVMADDADKRFLPPLRITAAGLRSLADAFDAHPDMRPTLKPREFEQLDEPPVVTALKAAVEKAQAERDQARCEAQAFRSRLARVRTALGDAA
jgi:hypothetical protein